MWWSILCVYLVLGILYCKPWNQDTGFFLFHIPWWVHSILVVFWFPGFLFNLFRDIKERGFFISIYSLFKKLVLHIWCPLILIYNLQDFISDGKFKQFEKRIEFNSKYSYLLFKKVQLIKRELGYIYWNIKNEYVEDNNFVIECNMCQIIN